MLFSSLISLLITAVLLSKNVADISTEQESLAKHKSVASAAQKFSRKPAAPSPILLHELIFATVQGNIDILLRRLSLISDPLSDQYGKFISATDIAKLTALPNSVLAIENFLSKEGIEIKRRTSNSEFITAEAEISKWETILMTKFHHYSRKDNKGIRLLRCTEYTLPIDIHGHVAYIFNAIDFVSKPQHSLRYDTETSINLNITINTAPGLEISGLITPSKLFRVYNVQSGISTATISQGVYSTLNQYYSGSDLTLFQSSYGVPANPVAHDPNGRRQDSQCVSNYNNCAESNLDIQYITAIGQRVPTTVSFDSANDALLAWITSSASTSSLPLVQSISYGVQESDLTPYYMNVFNTQAIKLAAMGITVVVSSGDDGAPGYYARSDSSKCGYDPQFPASSPYVVAVGATMGPETGGTEVACQSNRGGSVTSGGGFSRLSARPSYQYDAVSAYLSSVSRKPKAGYNTGGRGYPDIALAGKSYVVVIGGKTYLESGTSASTPVFAGMVSLVNAVRKNKGKSSLGWLTPALYQLQSSFVRDITSGDNTCTENVCCSQGFFASSGWDPVTGLGSLDFAKFLQTFVSI